MNFNNRISSIPEYHFAKLDSVKKNALKCGRKLTDLSIGDPDLSVSKNIIRGLIEGLKVKDYNKYPPYEGILELKKRVIKYYEEVYSVNLSLDEVIILIGSKEGINNIIPAVCDIGDYDLVPALGYPVYETCSHLWGVNTFRMHLLEENSYLPDFGKLSKEAAEKSKMMIVNYPNNPTGAVADSSFYKEAIKFCCDNGIILCNDGAYNEIIKSNEQPISLLQFDEKKQCIEFGTLSKIYNMTGFRVGYAVGNSNIIKALLKIKSNVDSGQFIPLQHAAIEALKLGRSYVNEIRKIYDERKIETYKLLSAHNISYFKGEGTFYIWCNTPRHYTTEEFCEELLNDYDIVVTPGSAFGELGRNYFRISLTCDKSDIINGLSRLKFY